ncbi:MAG: hypothetical protein PF904_11715 [Kiritimatiellae bacterium]|jgi:hypothetical protein|nr:hypothetical protein [Kiritimatiellia bacterium]
MLCIQKTRIQYFFLALVLWVMPGHAFEPTNLTDCVMWLQAGTGNIQTNTIEGRVSQWNDLSGNGNHAYQTDGNRQPLYVEDGPNGHPTLYFDVRDFNNAYNARLLTETPLTNACTTYIVARVLDANEFGIVWRRLLASRDKNWFLGTYTPGTFYMHGHIGEVSGMPSRLNSSYQFNRTYTLSAVNNTTEQRFFVNGFDLTGDSTKNTPPGRLSIGSADGYSDEGDAQISEVIAYDRALTLTERQQVEEYLAARYGVTEEGFAGPVWSGASGSSSLWSGFYRPPFRIC